jgi:hypothetical protein
MRKTLNTLPLVFIVLFSALAAIPMAYVTVDTSPVELCVTVHYAIPPIDNSMTNSHNKLLRYHSYSTINYYVNPTNSYGFTSSQVVNTINTATNTWDSQTSYTVFSYKGTTTRTAGTRDNYNIISWGSYQAGVIAVTMSWISGKRVLEVDCLMNTYYSWSLSGQAGKMDVQNIMTHELGHFCGLADLYKDADYWLTMYGYSNYAETYKQTLGLGDILGLRAVYGA